MKKDSGDDSRHQENPGGRLLSRRWRGPLCWRRRAVVRTRRRRRPAAGSGQLTAQDVDAFAKCMRSHGLPNFYPSRASSESAGSPDQVLELGPWIFQVNDPGSPQFEAAQQTCHA